LTGLGFGSLTPDFLDELLQRVHYAKFDVGLFRCFHERCLVNIADHYDALFDTFLFELLAEFLHDLH